MRSSNFIQACCICFESEQITAVFFNEIDKLDKDKQEELLSLPIGNGYTVAMLLAEKSRLPNLTNRLLDIYGNGKDLLQALMCRADDGATLGLALCKSGYAWQASDLLTYISKLNVNDRVSILSHRDNAGNNIHSAMARYAYSNEGYLAFLRCLSGMTEDQQARCI
jgi:hypothetical protein